MKTNTKRKIASAKLSLQKMASDIKDPAAIVGGMVIGKLAGDMLDKAITTTKAVAGLKGFDNLNTFIKPIVLIGGGLAIKQLVKNPLIKNIGIGAASYGGAVAVQGIINIPQLNSVFGNNTTVLAEHKAGTDSATTTAGFGLIPRRTLPGRMPIRTIGRAPAQRPGTIL